MNENPSNEEGARTGRRHAPFLASVIGTLVVVGIIAAVIRWGGMPKSQLRFVYLPLNAGLWSALVAWCVFYSAWRGPLRWRVVLPLLFLTYLGVERLAAPYFRSAFNLKTFTAVQDPDHRPHRTGAQRGWNSDSLRCPHQPETFREEDVNLIFLGDSFTFGMNLDADQCFPRTVEDLLQAGQGDRVTRVANFGWISSSPLLSWRRLVDIGQKYAPDVVVMCVDMTDIRDDIRWNAMLERDGAFWLIDRIPMTMRALQVAAPSAYAWLFSVLNPEMPAGPFFMSEAPLEQTRPFFDPIVKNLTRIEAWCADHGAHFVVIVLPRTYQYSDRECPNNWEADRYTILGPHSLEPFRFFAELQEEVSYPIHSLLDVFQQTDVFPTAFDDDPHWTSAGARVAAHGIYKILLEELASVGLR